jgi:hypothetical protein
MSHETNTFTRVLLGRLGLLPARQSILPRGGARIPATVVCRRLRRYRVGNDACPVRRRGCARWLVAS